MKRTPIKRHTSVRRVRSKPRPGRLRGASMKVLRMECFARDRGKCQICGIQTIFDAPRMWPNSYHMAHIRAKRMGLDKLSNVRCLCGTCHRLEHVFGKTMQKPCPKKPPMEAA